MNALTKNKMENKNKNKKSIFKKPINHQQTKIDFISKLIAKYFVKEYKIQKIIKGFKHTGKNKGYCRGCGDYFKKDEVGLIIDVLKVDRVEHLKLCPSCYLKQLAELIGWEKMSALILKQTESNI